MENLSANHQISHHTRTISEEEAKLVAEIKKLEEEIRQLKIQKGIL